MNTRVEFKSAAFPKYPNEDAELVNSRCWGKRLAEFVRDELPRYGVLTEDILYEDWGWLVNLKNEAFPLWIGCGVMDDPSDDDDNEDDDADEDEQPGRAPAVSGEVEFCVFVTAEPGLIQKWFKKVDTKPAVQKAVEGLRRLFEARPDIADARWS